LFPESSARIGRPRPKRRKRSDSPEPDPLPLTVTTRWPSALKPPSSVPRFAGRPPHAAASLTYVPLPARSPVSGRLTRPKGPPDKNSPDEHSAEDPQEDSLHRVASQRPHKARYKPGSSHQPPAASGHGLAVRTELVYFAEVGAAPPFRCCKPLASKATFPTLHPRPPDHSKCDTQHTRTQNNACPYWRCIRGPEERASRAQQVSDALQSEWCGLRQSSRPKIRPPQDDEHQCKRRYVRT